MKGLLITLLAFTLLIAATFSRANNGATNKQQPLRIAVSSNFAPVLKKILPTFYQQTGIKTQVISSATGTLYLQIKHGAPFDIFLSADEVHPQRLVQEQFAIATSIQTYAVGQLALFTLATTKPLPEQKLPPKNKSISAKSLTQFLNNYLSHSNQKFAIANPNNAPYGKASQQVFHNLSLWQDFQKRLVTGININQTFGQIRSQAVATGFVAQSQLVLNNLPGWLIPHSLYPVIKQQLVVLSSSQQKQQALQLSQFLLSEPVQQLIVNYGYAKFDQTQPAGND